MAITITNTGADTFISDGSQVPNSNKNFIAGLSKATVISNPLTGGLDSILVLDNTGRSIVMAYSDITDINGDTPAALGLTDATEVSTYLNNNFFDFGNGGLTTVATSFPVQGDGTNEDPLSIAETKTFTFEGGFTMTAPNNNYMVGTPLIRNNTGSVTMLTPGEPGRRPIVRITSVAGNWVRLATPNSSGCFIPLSHTTNKKFRFRQNIKIAVSGGGSSLHGIVEAPAITALGGFGFQYIGGVVRAFVNTGASYVYGASTFPVVVGTWYEAVVEYQYAAGSLVADLYINNVLVSTASKTVASFSNNCMVGTWNAGGGSALNIHTDLMEYSIYD